MTYARLCFCNTQRGRCNLLPLASIRDRQYDVTQHWAIAYICIPLCSLLVQGGSSATGPAVPSGWICTCCNEDCAMIIVGCIALVVTVSYVALTVYVRWLNSEWQSLELAPPESCTMPCQILDLQFVYVVVGCTCASGSMLLKCLGRRDFEWGEYVIGFFAGTISET